MTARDDYPILAELVDDEFGALGADAGVALDEIDQLREAYIVRDMEHQRMQIVIPAITAHLDKLRMDTAEDNELLQSIRNLWRFGIGYTGPYDQNPVSAVTTAPQSDANPPGGTHSAPKPE